MLVDVVDGADVGIVKGGGCACFLLESFERMPVTGHFFRQELQGNRAAKLGVFGLVADTHTSSAELLDDPVAQNGLAHHGECLHRQFAP